MLEGLFEKVRLWWIVETGAERLRQLDDHLLADLGVARDDIPRFVRGELPNLWPHDDPRVRPAALGNAPGRTTRRQPAGRRAVLAYAPRRRANARELECAK